MVYITAKKRDALAVFIKHFQWILIKQLKPRRRNPGESGKILIPEVLFDMFRNQFGVTGRFAVNEAAMDYFNLINIRYINNREYCHFENNEMVVRVSRTSKASLIDKDLNETKHSSGLYLFSYQFNRREEVIRV
jgi:hypothetical protein